MAAIVVQRTVLPVVYCAARRRAIRGLKSCCAFSGVIMPPAPLEACRYGQVERKLSDDGRL
jgi:hypothetical protein